MFLHVKRCLLRSTSAVTLWSWNQTKAIGTSWSWPEVVMRMLRILTPLTRPQRSKYAFSRDSASPLLKAQPKALPK